MSHILSLGLDVIFIISSFCSVQDTISLLCTCKTWHQLDDNESFWQSIFCNDIEFEIRNLQATAKSAANKSNKGIEKSIRALQQLKQKWLIKLYDHSAKRKQERECNFKAMVRGRIYGRASQRIRMAVKRLKQEYLQLMKQGKPLEDWWTELIAELSCHMSKARQSMEEWRARIGGDAETIWKLIAMTSSKRNIESTVKVIDQLVNTLHLAVPKSQLLWRAFNMKDDKFMSCVANHVKKELEYQYQMQRDKLLSTSQSTTAITVEQIPILCMLGHTACHPSDCDMYRLMLESGICNPKYYKQYQTLSQLEQGESETIFSYAYDPDGMRPVSLLAAATACLPFYDYLRKERQCKYILFSSSATSHRDYLPFEVFIIFQRTNFELNLKMQKRAVLDWIQELKEMDNQTTVSQPTNWLTKEEALGRVLMFTQHGLWYVRSPEDMDEFLSNFEAYVEAGCPLYTAVTVSCSSLPLNVASYSLVMNYDHHQVFGYGPYQQFIRFLVEKLNYDPQHPCNANVIDVATQQNKQIHHPFLTSLGFGDNSKASETL